MILLLVSESKISHIFTEHFDAIRVFAFARSATDFLYSTNNP